MQRLKYTPIYFHCHRFCYTFTVNMSRADTNVHVLQRLMGRAAIRAQERYSLLANRAHVTYDGLQQTMLQIALLEVASPRALERTQVGAEVRKCVA